MIHLWVGRRQLCKEYDLYAIKTFDHLYKTLNVFQIKQSVHKANLREYFIH